MPKTSVSKNILLGSKENVHTVNVVISTESDHHKPFIFAQNRLIHMPRRSEMGKYDRTHSEVKSESLIAAIDSCQNEKEDRPNFIGSPRFC